jgi:hypothetical protein
MGSPTSLEKCLCRDLNQGPFEWPKQQHTALPHCCFFVQSALFLDKQQSNTFNGTKYSIFIRKEFKVPSHPTITIVVGPTSLALVNSLITMLRSGLTTIQHIVKSNQ